VGDIWCSQLMINNKGGSGVKGKLLSYLWKVKTLPTTKFFAWRVLWGQVATKDNLIKGE